MTAPLTLPCSLCGTTVPAGESACGACGTTVATPRTVARRDCHACGAGVLATDRFCTACGAALDATPHPTATTPGIVVPGIASSPWEPVLRQLQAAVIDEFELVRELGRGGMAAVYLAHELALNRKVALKLMAPGVMMGEGMIERFRLEAVTVANLSHPHIVRVHAVRQVDDLHFIVMQYIAGRALDRRLRELGPLPIPLVRVILAQVASALGYAHRRGVVHRDIKPGNILFDASGDAIVTDFGIAKVSTAPSHTVTGSVIGTPTYMSPEQCDARPLTGASDMYSLGVVAYEMLTGRVPFEGSPFAIMQGHTDAPVPPIRDRRPDCPPELEAVVLRMLAKEPAARFATMAEAVAALDAPSLGDTDPLRLALIRLAAPDATAALDVAVPTPASPVPWTRRATPPTPAAGIAAPLASPAATLPPRTSPPTAAPPAPATPPPRASRLPAWGRSWGRWGLPLLAAATLAVFARACA